MKNKWIVMLKWGTARVLLACLISVFVSMWAIGHDYYWAAAVATFFGIGVWYCFYEWLFTE